MMDCYVRRWTAPRRLVYGGSPSGQGSRCKAGAAPATVRGEIGRKPLIHATRSASHGLGRRPDRRASSQETSRERIAPPIGASPHSSVLGGRIIVAPLRTAASSHLQDSPAAALR